MTKEYTPIPPEIPQSIRNGTEAMRLSVRALANHFAKEQQATGIADPERHTHAVAHWMGNEVVRVFLDEWRRVVGEEEG